MNDDCWTISPDGVVSVAAESFAAAVVEKLSASVIPSSFPAAVGDWIREACAHGASLWQHTIPMNGPTALLAQYRLNPDGTLNLEFRDTSGFTFWHGTFRPVEVKS